MGQVALDKLVTGEIVGIVHATQLPDVPCSMAKLKAVSTNAGSVFIGGIGVTKTVGNNNFTTGFELKAGQETGWMPISNLNNFYRICDNAGDTLLFMVLR
jgi:hypothetical protein